MSSQGWRCPNCGSEFASAIIWWKPAEQLSGGVHAHRCHDCDTTWEGGTNRQVSEDYEPPIRWGESKGRKKIPAGQADIFGAIQNIEQTISPRPKIVRSPAGEWVGVYFVPKEKNTPQYHEKCQEMLRDMEKLKKTWIAPPWFKYRTIRRGVKQKTR